MSKTFSVPLIVGTEAIGVLSFVNAESARRYGPEDLILATEIAGRAYATGYWPRKQLVADLLRHHARTGAIVADDPDILAEHFLGMVAGAPARLASFGIVRDPAGTERHTRTAVELFLRSLRPGC